MSLIRQLAFRAVDTAFSAVNYRFELRPNPLSSPLATSPRPSYAIVPVSGRPPTIAEQAAQCPISESVVARSLEVLDRVKPFYDASVEGPLQIAGAWRRLLESTRVNQLRAIQQRDVQGYRQLLADMFFNELLIGLQNYGTYVAGRRVPAQFLEECDAFERIADKPTSALATHEGLRLWGLGTERGIVKYTDPQHGIQATHILRLAQLLRGERPVTVLDLGSGFGGLAEKLGKWSSSSLRVVLMDIPLNLTTAYAYLCASFGEGEVSLVSSAAELSSASTRFVLVPTCLAPQLGASIQVHIVHNGKSFSEMDQATVDFYLRTLITDDVDCLIDTNSNRLASENFGGHREVASREMAVPSTHALVSRFQDSRPGRYVTSLYLNRRFAA